MATVTRRTPLAPGNGGVVYPSPNEWTDTTVEITGITRGTTTTVTAPGHGITTANQSTPVVDFTLVSGMQQINGKFGYVLEVIDADTILVGIDSSSFNDYTSGGYLNKIVAPDPIDPYRNTFD